MKKLRKGIFLSFEGIDGCGKGTQIEILRDVFDARGYPYEYGREPGGTEAGERIREILQNPQVGRINNRTELLLFSAARAEFVERRVLPVLDENKIFIADRFFDSTTAYQGYGLGFDLDFVRRLHEFSTAGLKPDLTFLFDVDPTLAARKVQGGEFGSEKDKIESRNIEYFSKVRNGYLEIADNEPERFRVIEYKENYPQGMQAQVMASFINYLCDHNLFLEE